MTRGPVDKQINSDKPMDDVQWELVRADIAALKAKQAEDRSKLINEQIVRYGYKVALMSNRELYVQNSYTDDYLAHVMGPDPRINK